MATAPTRRTAITRLSVTTEQRNLLSSTISEWKRGCQIATDMAWERCSSTFDVQSLAYDAIRDRTSLGSQHAILATHQAAHAIGGCAERRANGMPVSKPRFTAPTITYDRRTMTMFEDGSVSLTTVDDRIRCPLVLPQDEDGYQYQYLDNEEWTVTESTLTRRDEAFFLHIQFRRDQTDTDHSRKGDGAVLGVDLGIDNIAVTSTAQFCDGREFTHRLRAFQRVRGRLQRAGTRSAHRTLVKSSGRVRRYIRDVLHRTSNAVVEEARLFDCDVIVLEDLTHIREQTDASWAHVWAFRSLSEQIEYKGRAVGITVHHVGSAYTSTQCPECGYTSDDNRPSRAHFHCRECGTEGNADYIAAKNIGLRYVRRGQQTLRRTGDCQLALKSGTVNSDGEFTPYSEREKASFTDKSSRSEAKSSD